MSKYHAIGVLMLLLQCKVYAEVHMYNTMIPLVYSSQCGNRQIKRISLEEWNDVKKDYKEKT